jgi:8-oxo-dGTP pyrophosphatase MutT (NUDIX family)
MTDFKAFIDILTLEIGHGLPGWEAQIKMIVPDRGKPDIDLIEKRNPRKSSVLVWLYPKEVEIFTRLILRAEYPGVHSGQIAFPGGTWEETDKSLWDTALREASEEVGLPREKIKKIGELSPIYIPPSNFWVQPFIGVSEAFIPPVIDSVEVQNAIDMNIRLLLDPKVKEEKVIFHSSSKSEQKTPYYNIQGYTVWGATAMILSELEELIRRTYSKLNKN